LYLLVKKLYKALVIPLLLIIYMPGCIPDKGKNETIRVLLLRGPSAIAFAKWIDEPPQFNGKTFKVEIYDSPEKILVSLIRQEADIAILPMINAANLYNKNSPYILAGCPLWGTLFIVGRELVSTLHLFGTGTTPDILARYYLQHNNLDYQLSYSFGSAAETAQALLAGKANAAVLSEPFVSLVIQRNSSLHILADLNNPDGKGAGFAQTAVLLHPSLKQQQAQIDSLISESCLFTGTNPEKAISILENAGVFNQGTLTREAVKRNKIHYLPALEAENEIYSFLQVIESYKPKAIGGKLPDSRFIHGQP